MSERSVTIWNLLVGLTIVSLIATGFKLFPMNKKYNRIKARSSNVQFGTDKELENIIGFLESRLEERSKFQFQIENTPMMLTNVLSLADGSGKRARRNRRSEEHTSELQSQAYLVCRLLLEKKKRVRT